MYKADILPFLSFSNVWMSDQICLVSIFALYGNDYGLWAMEKYYDKKKVLKNNVNFKLKC